MGQDVESSGGAWWASLGFCYLLKVGIGSRLVNNNRTYVFLCQGCDFTPKDGLRTAPTGGGKAWSPSPLGPVRERGSENRGRRISFAHALPSSSILGRGEDVNC